MSIRALPVAPEWELAGSATPDRLTGADA